MPPSGYSKKGIASLTTDVMEHYKLAQTQYQTLVDYVSEHDIVEAELSEAEFLLNYAITMEEQAELIEPSLLVGPKNVVEYTKFITSCFRNLAQEIYDGKDKYQRQVIDGRAMQKEINQIKTHLEQYKI